MRYPATLLVNGMSYPVEVEPGRTLLSVLRDELGLTGTKEGCDDSECGACMVLLDGQPVNSCSYLALQADGRRSRPSRGSPRARSSVRSSGRSSSTAASSAASARRACSSARRRLLAANPDPTEDEIRAGLSGNLCRCTGYVGIIGRRPVGGHRDGAGRWRPELGIGWTAAESLTAAAR